MQFGGTNNTALALHPWWEHLEGFKNQNSEVDPHRNWQGENDKWLSNDSKQGLWHLLFSSWHCLPPSVTPQLGSELPWHSQWVRLGIRSTEQRIYTEQTKREESRAMAKSHLHRTPRWRGQKSSSMCLKGSLAHQGSMEMLVSWQGDNWLLSTAVVAFGCTRQEFKAQLLSF